MKIENQIMVNATLSKQPLHDNHAVYVATLDKSTTLSKAYQPAGGLSGDNYIPGHDIIAVVFRTELDDTHTATIVVSGKIEAKGPMMFKLGGIPFYSAPVARFIPRDTEGVGNQLDYTVFHFTAMEFITLKEGEISLELYYEATKPVEILLATPRPEQKG